MSDTTSAPAPAATNTLITIAVCGNLLTDHRTGKLITIPRATHVQVMYALQRAIPKHWYSIPSETLQFTMYHTTERCNKQIDSIYQHSCHKALDGSSKNCRICNTAKAAGI